MSKLLNYSLNKIILCAGIVLVCSIPIYYFALSHLWQYELGEHHVRVTPEAGREDSFLIIGAVTLLSAFFFIVLLGALILLNRRLSRRMWQPFYESLEQIKSFDLDEPSNTIFQRTGITEFDEMNASLQKLLSANLAVYNQQKEFADNASHELQTPLAIVQSKLDLLLQSKQLNDDQFQLIEEAHAALSRASRINKNLLLLTKIENSQFSERQTIDLSGILGELLVQFAPFFEEKKLHVYADIKTPVNIEGNRILIEILFGNLLTNVIRYSISPGEITVSLSHDRFLIANPGEESLQADQLFKRFATASSANPGTGLGLALVKQISMRYQWKAYYQFQGNNHTFQIRF
ncbi:sensor histidine kinase [Chitinophaga sp. RAB17]|uniref:sensor histidine kinase n=1 Tax=Chitinophaga sp. RAB17 TaxID=3233049 RepID=UPI003F8DA24C